MEKLATYLTPEQAAAALRAQAERLGATEFAQVRNLDYILAPTDLYPLAPRVPPPLPRIMAFAVDMDGTSTTTEPLALHALEYMVRRFTNRPAKADWPGLDERLDLPHVIGSSNFRHTEFLLTRYRAAIDRPAFAAAFIEAVLWTLANMTDPQRRRDVALNARNCGLTQMLKDPAVTVVQSSALQQHSVPPAGQSSALQAAVGPSQGRAEGEPEPAQAIDPARQSLAVRKYVPAFNPTHLSDEVAAALDIYYMRYHSILRELEQGRGEALARELLGAGAPGAGACSAARHLVEPMPGYDVFIPLIKGWLGPEIDALYEPLRAHLLKNTELGHARAAIDAWRPRLVRLADHFRRSPAKAALVTASIAYETHACMREVIRVMAERVAHWPVPAETRDRLAANLADYRGVFDGFACASDVWEARLKPHRDLYSLALFQMSIPRADYPCVVGLEDTEPGIIALRAAGVGCAVALPNHDTRRQDYAAAVDVIRGGLPELILARNLLLAE
ncbi:MAG: hypothetical protein AB1716_05360 [Planctomycetota bacterium]